MKQTLLRFFIAALACTSFALPAYANVIYANGMINGTSSAYIIKNDFALSNSFSIGNAVDLTSAEIGLWVLHGHTPVSVEWSIGSSAFASDFGGGMAVLTNVFHNSVFENFSDVFLSNFSLSVSLTAGDYWFTLQNANDGTGDLVYWDINSGPSVAKHYKSTGGNSPSEYFALSANTAVPEPSSFALLGLGLCVIANIRRRKK